MDPRSTAYSVILSAIQRARPELSQEVLQRRTAAVLDDALLLARCAVTKCLITYGDAIALRGHGNPQNGQWLDSVYAYALTPLELPDLTMLVVNQSTKQPNPAAFEARRSIMSKVRIDDVPAEQRRCIWYPDYELVFGPLEPIPSNRVLVKLLLAEPAKEREISRAVRNAVGRVAMSGKEKTSLGRNYPDSLPLADLLSLAAALWTKQFGRCALTGQKFDLRGNEDSGLQDDRVSLDRIDNSRGYASDNVQLVTQFANRARGTLSCEQAKQRLKQFHYEH